MTIGEDYRKSLYKKSRQSLTDLMRGFNKAREEKKN